MGLDDRVVLWKPQPSHLSSYGPREWSLVSPIPFLNVLGKDIGSEICLKGLIVINLPRVSEIYVVGHVLADRGKVNTSADTQTRKLGWVSNSREHQKLWSVENTCAQNDLFASGHFPPLTLCTVNERTRGVGHRSTY